MIQASVKVVFFDAAGTLFHVKGAVADVYLHYAKNYGVRETPELKNAISAAFTQAFQQAPPPVFSVSHPEKLKQCERLWWFDIVHAVFYRVGMFEGFDEYFEEVFEAFAGRRHWVVHPEVPLVLNELRSMGYELGIISNFDTRLFSILEELSLRSFFDTVTISSLVQAVKPSGRIFQHALAEHAVEPNEAVHIGDNMNEDWEGATKAGLYGVLLCSGAKPPLPTMSIHSFTELPGLLQEICTDT